MTTPRRAPLGSKRVRRGGVSFESDPGGGKTGLPDRVRATIAEMGLDDMDAFVDALDRLMSEDVAGRKLLRQDDDVL